LAQEALTLLLEVGVAGTSGFHIVVIILQYRAQKQWKTAKPTFISSTRCEEPACIQPRAWLSGIF
jgi:hypothetical protein